MDKVDFNWKSLFQGGCNILGVLVVLHFCFAPQRADWRAAEARTAPGTLQETGAALLPPPLAFAPLHKALTEQRCKSFWKKTRRAHRSQHCTAAHHSPRRRCQL